MRKPRLLLSPVRANSFWLARCGQFICMAIKSLKLERGS